MFISFEGIDNCGKTTQIKMLAEYLQKIELSNTQNCNKILGQCLVVREPGGTSLSESIRSLLLDNKMQMNSYTELFLFEAARSELIDKVIVPALTENTIVLADRFIDSTIAYQGYGRQLDLVEIKRLNAIATSDLKPDITFYLKIDLSTANARACLDNGNIFDRIESLGEEFFQRVIYGFNALAKEEPGRIVTIDATQSKELVFQDVIEKLGKLLV